MKQFNAGLLAVAVILSAVSCGMRGQKKNTETGAPETKAAEAVQETETYFHAIDKYLTEVIGVQYASGEVCIPYHDYISADESRQDDIQVWGSFWVDNYNVVGDTLMFVSGGSQHGDARIQCLLYGLRFFLNIHVLADAHIDDMNPFGIVIGAVRVSSPFHGAVDAADHICRTCLL